MTLREMRVLFTSLVVELVQYINDQGYEAAFNECGRSDEQSVINAIKEDGRARVAALVEKDYPALSLALLNNGKSNGILLSLHRDKLAVDIDLYKDGAYLSDNADHEPFGVWWEQRNPLCRWGGRFNDGNHYSLEWQGRK